MTPNERSQQARAAAHALHSQYDSRQLTKNARHKFNERFLDQVDPDRILLDAERLRRADHARKAYFIDLALKSAKVRKARAER